MMQAFKIIGANHWLGWYTNPYQDRDKEYLAEKAIAADVERMLDTGDYPELWLYHLEGSRLGRALGVGKAGRFAFAVGEFDPSPYAQTVKAHLMTAAPAWKLSHGFTYDESQFEDGVYHAFQTFEISLLKADDAANPYTAFTIERKSTMQDDVLTQKAQAAIGAVLAEAGIVFEDVLAEGQTRSKALDHATARNYKASEDAMIEEEMKQEAEMIEAEIEAKADDPIALLNAKLDKLMLMLAKAGMADEESEAEIEIEDKGDSYSADEVKALKSRLAALETETRRQKAARATVTRPTLDGLIADYMANGQKAVNTSNIDVATAKALRALGINEI